MLEKLTIKDFIKYNSPCKCCNDIPHCFFKLSFAYASPAGSEVDAQEIPVDIIDGIIEVPISIDYSGTKSLLIDPITNKYIYCVPDYKKYIDEFMKDSIMWIESFCKNCETKVSSNNLEFSDTFIEPTSIMYETVNVRSKTHDFTMITYFPTDNENGRTDVLFSEIGKKRTHNMNYIFDVPSEDHITIDLLPLGKFKSKEDIVSKLETILTFR